MRNLLYFSDYFKLLALKLKFISSVIAKFLSIIFRRRRGIALIQLDCSRKYVFDESYLIISYNFKNALWYNFKDIKRTTERQSLVLNLKNLATSNITLIVYGFFQKNVYKIGIRPEKTLDAKSFKATVSGLNQQKTFSVAIEHDRKNALVNIPHLNVTKKNLAINNSTYNQIDFI